MKVEVNMTGLDGVLDTLKSLPPEVVSRRGGPVRRALAKAGRLIRDQARANVAAAIALPGLTGVTESTGFTAENVILKRRALTQIKGERYIVTVRNKAHPSGNKYRKRQIKANDIAFMLEAGTAKQPATPWLRPAFAARAGEAVQKFETELLRDIERIVKKLAAKNRGR